MSIQGFASSDKESDELIQMLQLKNNKLIIKVNELEIRNNEFLLLIIMLISVLSVILIISIVYLIKQSQCIKVDSEKHANFNETPFDV